MSHDKESCQTRYGKLISMSNAGDLSQLLQQATQLDEEGWAIVHRAPQSALKALQAGLGFARASGDQRVLSTLLRHNAYARYGLGDFDTARLEASEAVHVARTLEEPFLIAAAVNILGVVLRYRGELTAALEAQLEHLRLAEQIGHPQMRAHALNNIGSVHLDLNEFERALSYHEAACTLAETLGDDVTLLKAKNNRAMDLHHLGRLTQAQQEQSSALQLARLLTMPGEEALALNGLARLALSSRKYQEARDFAEMAHTVARQVNDQSMLAEAHLHAGLASLEIGDLPAAGRDLASAVRVSERAVVPKTQCAALYALARTAEQQGRLSDALSALKSAHALDLRLHAETARQRTTALKAVIEAEYFRNEVERERARSAELASMIQALQDARARQEELALKLAHQATHDALTGLAGRALFEQHLEQAILNAAHHQPLGVLFIDLNGFKKVNDTYGHAVGDLLLQEVARRLTGAARQRETVARLGGDEFVVLVTHIREGEQVTQMAQALLHVLTQPFIIDGLSVRVGAAVGVSVYPQDGLEAGMLLRRADAAMYQAKQSGESTVCCS